jgi:UDPglucose 6-dehydrogenase
MKIGVIGSGYVGLVTGACLADFGHNVACYDRDRDKIAGLRVGKLPIFEPGLEELISRQVREERLTFHDDVASIAESEVCFIAVGTPSMEDGSADRRHVLSAAEDVVGAMKRDMLLVIKSTVPPGTCDLVKEHLAGVAQRTGLEHAFDVASNPEFLREGTAIADFVRPDRIVVGSSSHLARQRLRDVYKRFSSGGRAYIELDPRSSEMSKFVANAMLATRISFMNEMAQICERVGADVLAVRRAIGLDTRIGPSFLFPGIGYGGSCFPKDVKALARLAIEADCPARILEAVDRVNAHQQQRMANRILQRFGGKIRDQRIAIWGLAFKPQTDDIRESPAVAMVHRLAELGAELSVYDPEAGKNGRAELARWERVRVVDRMFDAPDGADALLIATEWDAFREPDFPRLSKVMRQRILFDGRNLLDPAIAAAEGFEYHGIGRPR